ncbi:MAG: hypothetical protein FWH18_12885 [Marinilabiliaceae bacterium]|nr:hypothetical protein [Marinilabiliaceae bacterium]
MITVNGIPLGMQRLVENENDVIPRHPVRDVSLTEKKPLLRSGCPVRQNQTGAITAAKIILFFNMQIKMRIFLKKIDFLSLHYS